jgi:hypothetical protein
LILGKPAGTAQKLQKLSNFQPGHIRFSH